MIRLPILSVRAFALPLITALGLSMVFGMARQSGGTVTIESTPGKGTTVTIFLRHTTEAPAAQAPPRGP